MTFRLVHADSDREYLRAPGEELQTDLGVLTVPEDATAGDTLETHLGEPFHCRALRTPDLFEHFERTGAPMLPRDVGLVLGETGASEGDRALDAGTGTGVLAAALGRVGVRVTSYEVDPEFAAVARENVRLAGVADRVEVRTGDVADAVRATAENETTDETGTADESETPSDDTATADEGETPNDDPKTPDDALGEYDLLTLDTADAPAVVRHAPDLLVPGGFCAVYSPFVEDARAVVTAAREAGLDDVRAVETIHRRLQVDDRGTRPDTAPVGHTGYLTFARNR